jgi:hypothetical protein
MKINGINLHSTFPGEIQLLTTCDTVGGMKGELNRQDAEDAKVLADGVQACDRHGAGKRWGRVWLGRSIWKLEPTHVGCYESWGAGAAAGRSTPLISTDVQRYSMEFKDFGQKIKKII